MDRTYIDAIGRQFKGTLKEGLGKVIGDAKLTADGSAERIAGESEAKNAPPTKSVAGIDTDRIIGAGRQFTGAVKEGIGDLFCSTKMAAEGSAERAAGKAQNEAGSARDEALELAATKEPK
jgi:uncharacterized protein YjbJ (UPF0337 family)